MTSAEVRELYAYNHWANERLLDAVEPLSHEQFTRDMKSSYASIRDTLGHILAAEWVWLSRWKGTSPTEVLPGWNTDPYAEMRARWARHDAELRAFVDAVSDDALARPLAYRNLAGEPFVVPLSRLMQHLANHSTYHRGQVVTMLRQLGVTPPATDFSLYYTTVVAPAIAAR